MNYLAHLFLAEKTAESWIGNLLGDFVKGSLESQKTRYCESILKGIETHRQVDSFTDNHLIFKRSKQRIVNKYHHFSGIIIDVFYDHFLAKNWTSFSSETLEDFAAKIYQVLEINRYVLPEKLQKALPKMIVENWLVSYRELNGVDLTCQRLSVRIKRANNIALAQRDLIVNYSELESDFFSFFPEIINFVETNRSYS